MDAGSAMATALRFSSQKVYKCLFFFLIKLAETNIWFRLTFHNGTQMFHLRESSRIGPWEIAYLNSIPYCTERFLLRHDFSNCKLFLKKFLINAGGKVTVFNRCSCRTTRSEGRGQLYQSKQI